jgi:hypothetical protein
MNFNKKRQAIKDSIKWINDKYAANTNDRVFKFTQIISDYDFVKHCLTLGLKKEEAELILVDLANLKQIERYPSLFSDKMEYFRKLGTEVGKSKLKELKDEE